jgi:predicted  nucleic acid-binding Zn-ribbon protein
MIGLAVFVALVAILAAVALFLQSRTARDQAARKEAELARFRQDLEALRGESAAARAELKDRRDEAASLRAELGATKKKAFEQAEAAKRSGGAIALRAEIDKLTTRLAEARAEAAHHAERTKALETSAAVQAKEMERLRAAAERKPEPVAAPIVVTAAPVTPAPAAEPAVEIAKLEAERERADRAEAKLVDARKRIADLEKDVKAVRGRLETEKRVYMVQRGELELAADRYAELRRRHDQLRRDHDELVEAVRQAAREDRRLTRAEEARATAPKPEAAAPGSGEGPGATGAA